VGGGERGNVEGKLSLIEICAGREALELRVSTGVGGRGEGDSKRLQVTENRYFVLVVDEGKGAQKEPGGCRLFPYVGGQQGGGGERRIL